MNPFLLTDGYKTGHHKMYPEGTVTVYSNFTPRHGKHSNIKNGKGVISFGQQMVVKQILEIFEEGFFQTKLRNLRTYSSKSAKELLRDDVCEVIKREYSLYLDEDYDVSHIEALWDLGYLPIKVKSLPEGTFVPYGVPVLTIVNTHPQFFWLTNFLETLISTMLWMPMTSATTSFEYKKILVEACKETDEKSIDFVDFQGHNFSMRGMAGIDATIYASMGHDVSFKGDDSLPAIMAARKYYGAEGFVVGSVNATEHSVMCAGTKGDEIGTFRYLMEQFPTKILSIVSDTWDLWQVCKNSPDGYLVQLKDEIMSRDGKIVIRPDSGDPVDIICGISGTRDEYSGEELRHPSYKGVVELLWDIFGGTENEQGFKVLDPHIGCIYGDSITLDRAKQITERLKAKGFASTNVVLGIGSYTYQFVTRDTHGFAMKATYVEVTGDGNYMNAEGREIFKDPITDDGSKKSAKGLLKVEQYPKEQYQLVDQVDWTQEEIGHLKTIFEDGELHNQTTLNEIRERINQLIRN